MRIHVPGLPHTETTKEWTTCAFTQKIRHLCDMLMSTGHEVFLYASEANEANCSEHIVVATSEDRQRWFGDETWQDKVFDRWDLDDPCWVEYNRNVITAMMTRIEPGDFLALPMGKSHEQIAQAYPDILSFESGIGYEVIIPDAHHVFESSAWMHNRYGCFGIVDGRFYDQVIPNAFDEDEFFITRNEDKEDYVLFLGRHTQRKGKAIVEEVAKHFRVVTAGQRDVEFEGTEYAGVVRGKERAELISKARALLAPTVYIEPFGGVVVEAQLSGTTPITTDFGAFTETIEHEVSGLRCHTLAEFLDAVEKAAFFYPWYLRSRAVGLYSTSAIAPQYDAYLNRLSSLYTEGWYKQ